MNAAPIMMVAGERSGDLYGGELAVALRAKLPGLEIFGCGGEAMRQAGVETVVDAHRISMAGISEVVSGLPRAYRALGRLVREAKRRRPALAVLIDFPDFNLRLAKKLRRDEVRIVYFVSPQIWAWRPGRIKQIKACIDEMLCIFDFEEAIYRRAGIPVEYVGHPMVDLVRPNQSREEFCATAGLDPATPTVVFLPGSREREVGMNLPTMLDGASRLALERKIQFAVAVAPSLDPEWMEAKLLACYVGRARVRTVTHSTYDALYHSDLAIVASGTATIEAALAERPMVVVYRVSPFTWQVGKFLVKVPYYSMVNLLAGKAVVTELLQEDFTAEKLASAARNLLDHAEAREKIIQELRALKPRLGAGGAIQRAAEAVMGWFEPAAATLRHS